MFYFLPRLLVSSRIYSVELNAAPYRHREPSVYKIFMIKKKPGLNNKNERLSYGKAAIGHVGYGDLSTLYVVHLKFKKMK